MSFDEKKFADFIIENNVIGFFENPVVLKSGQKSNWYVNWRTPTSDAYLMDQITDFVVKFIKDKGLNPDCILGVPEGATKLGVLSQFKWDYNIVLALFAEEEKGLRGSYNLANRMKKENVDLKYVINFEMIGKEMKIGENKVYLTGYEMSNLALEINSIVPGFANFFTKSKEFNLFKRSDNYPFYKKFGIPSQTLSSYDFENYKYYHHFDDEVDNLNIVNLNKIIVSSAFFISTFLNEKTEISLNNH